MTPQPKALARIVAYFVMSAAVLGVGFVGTLIVIGSIVETHAEQRETYDRCLKLATNGAEIMECGR